MESIKTTITDLSKLFDDFFIMSFWDFCKKVWAFGEVHFVGKTADSRLNKFFLMQYYVEPFIILTLYLYIIFGVGHAWMRKRKPYSLKRVITIYNLVQIFVNGFLFYLFLHEFPQWNWTCTPPAPNSPKGSYLIQLHYYYVLLKFLDLLETIFFVLRKKQNQISTLHIYHHCVMIVIPWGVLKYYPGGQGSFTYMYNSFIHFIMYIYYLVAPSKTKSLWWKKYVTTVQIIQHFMVFTSLVLPLLNRECTCYPKIPLLFIIINNIIIIILFVKFYIDNYSINKKK